jgi:hypothetical protein
MRARHGPLPVGFKWQSKHVIGNEQIPVSTARHRFGNDLLHFLRHDPYIGRMAAVVDEAIVAEAVAEPSEQNNIVLKPEVGAPPATTASAMAAASMPAAESTAPAAVESATAHPPASEAAAVATRPSAAKTAGSCAAAKSAGAPAAVESGVAPARETARSTTMAGAWPVGWAIRSARAARTASPTTARTIATPWTIASAWTITGSANAAKLP